MSLDAAAARLADHLLEQEFVEVLAHHDADGIAAASILCHALFRGGRQFRLRIAPSIAPEDLPKEGSVLLCDFGSSLADLPEGVMVVDHHVPHFEGEYHVNPHLEEIDGERELSASGAAYLVAQHMGDNRDLVGLALLGVIGGGQEFAGLNRDLLSDGIANGFVAPRRGMRLVGRDLTEQLTLAINPFIAGISGDESAARTVVEQCTTDDGIDLESLISLVLLRISPQASLGAMFAIYGTIYGLAREVVDEAHTLAALVDACGKAGAGDLGASLCLRSTYALEKAWGAATGYRRAVIAAVRSARRLEEDVALYEVDDGAITGDVADALTCDRIHQDGPVFVVGRRGDRYSASARCPPGVDVDLEALMRTLAETCGGRGGGHRSRAGAWIPPGGLDRFRQRLVQEVVP